MSNLHKRAKRHPLGHTLLAMYTCEFGSRTLIAGGLSAAHADELAALLRENPRVTRVHISGLPVEAVSNRREQSLGDLGEELGHALMGRRVA